MLFTTNDLTDLTGRRGLLTYGKLTVLVDVLDSRQGCWARIDCLVTPVAGSGEQWVSAERLSEPTYDLHSLTIED